MLRGAAETLAGAKEAYVLLEDFDKDSDVVAYLQSQGWNFVDKFTPYNSFWTPAR
jgi:hypothetical protein